MSTIIKWSAAALCAVILFTVYQHHKRATPFSADQIAQTIASHSRLPNRVNDITELESISGAGSTVTFGYSVAQGLDGPKDRQDTEVTLDHQLKDWVCNRDPQAKEILADGYIIERRYSFQGGSDDIVVSVSKQSCASGT
ncbi:hypothetical protein [Rhodanobacter sp. A1T4]|uniref:hypothetical protein n=1 Tax=Rhodanobacter sp. A1T4 TaxID=2723087 RepID=UPI001622CF04|nr:hypothetical protein [Rhodanobacter sp. A1T4]MBB6247157.1 hypothetical protein [Rhodanobacter sp. A1T4]